MMGKQNNAYQVQSCSILPTLTLKDGLDDVKSAQMSTLTPKYYNHRPLLFKSALSQSVASNLYSSSERNTDCQLQTLENTKSQNSIEHVKDEIIERAKTYYTRQLSSKKQIFDQQEIKSQLFLQLGERYSSHGSRQQKGDQIVQKIHQQEQLEKRRREKLKSEMESRSRSSIIQDMKSLKSDKINQFITNKIIIQSIYDDQRQKEHETQLKNEQMQQNKFREIKKDWKALNKKFSECLMQRQENKSD